MSTKSAVTDRTGFKFYFWATLVEIVAYTAGHLGILPLPPKYESLRPLIGLVIGGIGKMIASYVATQGD